MEEHGPRALFAGDLSDPWVASIADALPRAPLRISCPGPLPDRWPASANGAATVVVHRQSLDSADADRLRRLRTREGGPPRLVLCVGPHVRYHQIERWAGFVDAILPEATAAEVVARHAWPADAIARRRPHDSPQVAVLGANVELRLMLADTLRRAGYSPHPTRNWDDVPPDMPALWDVPTLDPDWPRLLAHRSQKRALVALAGFLDRQTVTLARSSGALACLDLPVDPSDLVFVLDRMIVHRSGKTDRDVHPPHLVPPAPAIFRNASIRQSLSGSGDRA